VSRCTAIAGFVLVASLTGCARGGGPAEPTRSVVLIGLDAASGVSLNPDLEELTVECLAKKPDGRPADAGVALERLLCLAGH
jgi:hypothetical protein